MENLNAEKIKKALECCHTKGKDCLDCPYENDHSSCIYLGKNALALIKELTEENERLKSTRYYLHSDGRMELIPTVELVKAYTVREMAEMIKEEIAKHTLESFQYFANGFIDRIANEILEDTKWTNTPQQK